MIPKAYITAWRANAPWPTDAQVEQDLVICRALVELYSDSFLANEIAFRGGTALHKLFFDPAGRYSEDIDLVQVQPGPIGPVINRIREQLDSWLGKPQWKQAHGRVTLVYRFETESRPVTRLRLKIEINTREHFTVYPHDRRLFQFETLWHAGSVQVLTYATEELLGTKLRALYQRKKGRDLFDLSEALTRIPAIDPDRIVECFTRYLGQAGHRVSRAEFEANMAGKIGDRIFLSDMSPLLAPDTAFDPMKAMRHVERSLIVRLPGEPWKGRV